MEPEVDVVEADLARSDHARDVVAMTAAYALDPFGNSGPLPEDVLERLVPALRAHPTALVFLAYRGGGVVGIAICFLGFSTFAARPLVDVHDFSVLPNHRGLGVGRALLAAVERAARARGCVKMTLEVLEMNARARRIYAKYGFSSGPALPAAGGALFYTKAL